MEIIEANESDGKLQLKSVEFKMRYKSTVKRVNLIKEVENRSHVEPTGDKGYVQAYIGEKTHKH